MLKAVQEVRDALINYRKEKERSASLRDAVEAARAAEELAKDQYRNGLSDFNNVLDAQRSLLSFQEELAVSEGTVSRNTVRLYKALGAAGVLLKSSPAVINIILPKMSLIILRLHIEQGRYHICPAI